MGFKLGQSERVGCLGSWMCTLRTRTELSIPDLPLFLHHHPDTNVEAMIEGVVTMSWRPDETLVDFSHKEIVTLDFTRAWDADPRFNITQDALKSQRSLAWHHDRHLQRQLV